jgi:hypothetical protein
MILFLIPYRAPAVDVATAQDGHPDAHAVRLKFSLAIMDRCGLACTPCHPL